MIWSDVGFLKRNKTAKKIIQYLKSNDSPVMPSEISKATDMSIKNVSTRLGYLTKRGLVKCLNPNDKKGRLYVISDKGKKILREVKN